MSSAAANYVPYTAGTTKMKPLSHSDVVMIALCSFYAAVFFRVAAPGAPIIVYVAIGAALYCAAVIGILGFRKLRKGSDSLL